MVRLPPRSKLTNTLLPYTWRFRSAEEHPESVGGAAGIAFSVAAAVAFYFWRRNKAGKDNQEVGTSDRKTNTIPAPLGSSSAIDGADDEEDDDDDEEASPTSGVALAHINNEPPSDVEPPPPEHAPRDIV